MLQNTIDDIVLALFDAPVDERTGNKVVYNASWVADKPSMIGKVNEDWVRRELDWFGHGSDKLSDMEGPVPQLFQACAGHDGRVNSAYGYILFNPDALNWGPVESLYDRVVKTLINEGKATRHATAIISHRDIQRMAVYDGRNDFICTNALNIMIDADDRLHINAQMRSMDAVFGYRADWSMWDLLMDMLLKSLSIEYPELTRGDIVFQVSNLHVYPRHLALLEDVADDTHERLNRLVWAPKPYRTDEQRAMDGAADGGRLG